MPLSKLFKKRNSLKNTPSSQISVNNKCEHGNSKLSDGKGVMRNEAVGIENNQLSKQSTDNIDSRDGQHEATGCVSVQETDSNFPTGNHNELVSGCDSNISSEDGLRNKDIAGCVSVEQTDSNYPTELHLGPTASCENNVLSDESETREQMLDCASIKQTNSNEPESNIEPVVSCDNNFPNDERQIEEGISIRSTVEQTESNMLTESNDGLNTVCGNSVPNQTREAAQNFCAVEQADPNISKELNAEPISSCDNMVSSQPILSTNETTVPMKINRSASLQEGRSDSKPLKSRRKKCNSESTANNSTDDEGFEERVIQFRGKDLEKVIGDYVSKLIRESIVTAVRSATMESLQKELTKAMSSRSESESSECPPTIEQKLHTDSVTKYVELESTQACGGSISDEKIRLQNKCATLEKDISESSVNADQDTGEQELPNDASESKRLEVESLKNGGFDGSEPNYNEQMEYSKEVSIDGYHADVEESVSIHSVASESSCDDLLNPIRLLDVGQSDSMSSEEENDGNNDDRLNIRLKFQDDVLGEDIVEKPSEDVELKTEQLDPRPDMLGETQVKVEIEDLILMSGDEICQPQANDFVTADPLKNPSADLGENLPERQRSTEEEKKINWKVGYLQVKLPHKSRGKGHLKVWKKRCVSIQPDEFVNDPKNPSLMMSVYSGDSGVARKHGACFWKSVSGQKAVVYRSNSKTHPYAFTVSEEGKAIIHLSADSEAASQEWMAAIRDILWPPSPVMQLEKMLNGSQFEIAIIDNDFSYRAGLLGMYGYLTITQKKLILVHPQQGYVIQEWYLNTVDKFQLMPQTRIEDAHKVLAMTTCSDSSTGKGDLLMFCCEAVTLLQSLASTIHQVLTYHSNQEGGKYQKELEEMAEWLVGTQSDTEDYYKVPPRQVKSLLDIPNFIFNKPLTPVATIAGTKGVAMDALKPIQEESKMNPTRTSQDSGISAETCADDVLNCSLTSFVIGGGPYPGKWSDSELSDSYTPPQSPQIQVKHQQARMVGEF